jgi:hypothetical protein
VVDETVTLLLVRHSHNAAVGFLDTVERSETLRLEWIGPERFTPPAPYSADTRTRSGHSLTASASALCASCVFAMRSPPSHPFKTGRLPSALEMNRRGRLWNFV